MHGGFSNPLIVSHFKSAFQNAKYLILQRPRCGTPLALARVGGSMWSLTKPVKVITAALVLLIFATGLSKDYGETRRVRGRGHVVASVVHEQKALLQRLTLHAPAVRISLIKLHELPDDSLLLESYLISLTAGNADLKKAYADLKDLTYRENLSLPMRTSLERWQRQLRDWSNQQSRGLPSMEYLMSEGRKHALESLGYRKIGRGYDSVVLDLWSISLLSQFVERAPNDARVPEAIYLLANSYVGLRYALPRTIKADRILNLVAEHYPDSIWSKQANQLWQTERGNET